MTKLSPKALRFIDAAVAESTDARVKATWKGFDRSSPKELPGPVARAALAALQQIERRLRRKLDLMGWMAPSLHRRAMLVAVEGH